MPRLSPSSLQTVVYISEQAKKYFAITIANYKRILPLIINNLGVTNGFSKTRRR